ncbi:MAG: type II toxin-antitoxin system HicA family toxin [Chloroflexi bacterium]|nr:type II toxin-antitoxin system HicA family toxin [Chloroflexota bacterium]
MPVLKGDDAIKAFGKGGFKLDHWQGGHAILYHADKRHLSIPGGRKELAPGTLRTLIRKAGLSVDDFVKLL